MLFCLLYLSSSPNDACISGLSSSPNDACISGLSSSPNDACISGLSSSPNDACISGSKDLTAASKLLTEEREILRKRNTFSKLLINMDGTPCRNIWTVLSLMIRTMLLISVQLLPEQQQSVAVNHMTGQQTANISDKFASRGGAKFNARNFFRGFGQFNGEGSRGQQQQFVGKCFYCNQR